jgi:hypothetical protein
MVLGVVHGRVVVGREAPLYLDRHITEEDTDMPRDRLKALVGDGLARVTSSFELSDKDYGNGFGVHCAVTLTCDQSEDEVDRAADLGAALACRFAESLVDAGHALFKTTIQERR